MCCIKLFLTCKRLIGNKSVNERKKKLKTNKKKRRIIIVLRKVKNRISKRPQKTRETHLQTKQTPGNLFSISILLLVFLYNIFSFIKFPLSYCLKAQLNTFRKQKAKMLLNFVVFKLKHNVWADFCSSPLSRAHNQSEWAENRRAIPRPRDYFTP